MTTPPPAFTDPQPLPPDLWGREGGDVRSDDLSPMYIYHYVGALTDTALGHHGFWELLFVFDGRGSLFTPAEHPLADGRSYLIPPGMDHREESARPLTILWVGLQGTRLARLDEARLYGAENPAFAPLFEQLWLRAQRPYGRVGPELDGLTLAAFGQFLRVRQEQDQPGRDMIDEAARYLSEHYGEAITVSGLAARFGVSEGHFYRTFKARTGRSPLAFLTAVRLQHAQRWLTTSHLSVGRIAGMVGYRDPLYFSRLCRKHLGRSPARLREQGRGRRTPDPTPPDPPPPETPPSADPPRGASSR